MAAAGLLGPPALLVAAAAVCLLLGRLRPALGGARAACAGGAVWLAAAALAAAEVARGGAPLLVAAPFTVAAVPIELRLDAVTGAFGLLALVPAGLLLSFRAPGGRQASLALLAVAVAVLTIEADRLLLAALGLGAVGALLAALGPGGGRAAAGQLAPAWLLALLAAAALEVGAGTSNFEAVPAPAFGWPVFGLLAAAGLIAAGLLPWPSGTARARTGPAADRDGAGWLAVALLLPLGCLLLVRGYTLGAGRWPGPWLNLVLAAWGAATALGAGWRAQAAPFRCAYLSESVTLSAGLGLLGIAVGSQSGLAAGMAALAGAGLLAGLAPLLPSRGSAALAGLALAAGAPPLLVFGGRLLAVQTALDAGGALSLAGLVGGVGWLLGVAGGARAASLEAEAGATPASLVGSWIGLAALAAGGVGLGALVTLIGAPAAAALVPARGPALQGGLSAVSAAADGWPAALLGGPMLVAVGLVALARRRRRPAAGAPVPRAAAAPAGGEASAGRSGASEGWGEGGLVRLPAAWREVAETGRGWLIVLRLAWPQPSSGGGGPDARRLPGLLAAGNPWLWAAATLAAILLVAR